MRAWGFKDEVYIGVLTQGKRAKVSYKVKREIQKPKSEWVRVENAHEAIVDQRTFDTVRLLLGRDTIKALKPGNLICMQVLSIVQIVAEA